MRESSARPIEILMVEDNIDDARLAIEALKFGNIRHRMTLVWNGMEALQFLFRQERFAQAPRPDLILLDLGLPEIDGREVLVHVKDDPDLASIPIVILTASREYEDRYRGEMLNVEGYLDKPVDLPKFLRLVRQLHQYWGHDVILPVAVPAH